MSFSIRAGILFCSAAAVLSADTLTLRSGQTLEGTYIGGTARQVRMDLNGDIRTFELGEVRSLTFSDPGYQAPPPVQRDQRGSAYPAPPYQDSGDPALRRAPGSDAGDYQPPPPPSQVAGITIPIDTRVTIRMIDAVNSDTAHLGQTFRASLDEPILVDGREAIPRGADVLTKLVADQQSGKIQGRTVLTLALSTVSVHGQPVDVTSTDVQTSSSSRGARSGGAIGGGAVLGAIIGAAVGGW